MWVSKFDVCEKGYIWKPATCNYENAEYFASITDDPVTTCEEIIDAV